MGRGQGQGQLLVKLNKRILREDFKNYAGEFGKDGDLTRVAQSMSKPAFLSLFPGLGLEGR